MAILSSGLPKTEIIIMNCDKLRIANNFYMEQFSYIIFVPNMVKPQAIEKNPP